MKLNELEEKSLEFAKSILDLSKYGNYTGSNLNSYYFFDEVNKKIHVGVSGYVNKLRKSKAIDVVDLTLDLDVKGEVQITNIISDYYKDEFNKKFLGVPVEDVENWETRERKKMENIENLGLNINELPKLIGSEKQNKWAEDIRKNILAKLNKDDIDIINFIKTKKEAVWFINNRKKSVKELKEIIK